MTTVTAVSSSTPLPADSVAVLTLIAILVLVGMLIAREVMTTVPGRRARTIGRILDVATVPLLIAFVVILASKIVPSFA